MSRKPCHKSALPKHTAFEVEGWIALQRENKWSVNKLALHLGKGFDTVKIYIEKYELGLLP